MKELVFLPGGEVRWVESTDPEMFSAGVRIAPTVAAVSTGTELEGFRKMKRKADGNYKPGYSMAGRVLEVGPEASTKGGAVVGQRVACYGAPYTYHKTLIVAPWTLVHAIPENVSDEEASLCGLAAIGMHGLRRGNFTAGERVAILGMGILGQLAEQMLRAWGCETLAVDRHTEHLDIARRLGCRHTFDTRDGDLVEAAIKFAPAGVDGVIVNTGTAGAIMDQAAGMCRDRGRLVLVGGDERVDVSRSILFRKELDVLISRAGGPGRYDPQYERLGQDIPPAWVRWTEGRNVAEFLAMVGTGQLKVKELITHRYPHAEAASAYSLLDSPNRYEAMGMVFSFS